jgi:hypothetical protein
MNDDARRTGPAVEAHYQLLNWLMPTIARFPREQRFLLGDRIQATALDVLEAQIEATYTRKRRAHLVRANLGLEKLRFFFRLAHEQRHRRSRPAGRRLGEREWHANGGEQRPCPGTRMTICSAASPASAR